MDCIGKLNDDGRYSGAVWYQINNAIGFILITGLRPTI